MKLCVMTCASLALAGTASAVNFTGTYSQNFDGLGQSGAATIVGQGPHAIEGVLGSTGMDGWFGANFLGSSTSTEFKAHDGSLGSSAGRGVVFFGTNGSSDRALGTLATSNQISSFGLVLTNTSSDTYQSLDVSFIGEQWRAGDPNLPNVLNFAYGFGSSLTNATTAFSALNFNTPFLGGTQVAVNGNDPAFQTAVSNTITGLNWAPGQSLVLRWNGVDLSGQDNGLAIDNLVVTGVIPAPGAIALLGLAGLVGGRRRRA